MYNFGIKINWRKRREVKQIKKYNREKDCGRLKSDNDNEQEMQTEKNEKGRLNKRDKYRKKVVKR